MVVNKLKKLLFALVLTGPVCASVQAAGVTFLDLDDSTNATVIDTRELFSVPGSIAGPTSLEIGLSDFVANGNLGGTNIVAFDTLSFKVVADPGYYLTGMTYLESGLQIRGPGGVTVSTGSVVANGVANDLGLVIGTSPTGLTTWSLGTVFDFTGLLLTEITVSITNSMLGVGDGAISKTAAGVSFELTPVPLPPAVGLLGAAVVAMATINRRRT